MFVCRRWLYERLLWFICICVLFLLPNVWRVPLERYCCYVRRLDKHLNQIAWNRSKALGINWRLKYKCRRSPNNTQVIRTIHRQSFTTMHIRDREREFPIWRILELYILLMRIHWRMYSSLKSRILKTKWLVFQCTCLHKSNTKFIC